MDAKHRDIIFTRQPLSAKKLGQLSAECIAGIHSSAKRLLV